MLIITIKQGKEKSLLAGDPWIYASAIEKVEGKPQEKNKPGATATVQTSSRQFIGRAAYNAKSQICARIWTYKEDEPVDHAMIKRRVKAAIAKRAASVRAAGPNDLVPVVRGDEDGLSGLLVDSWGGVQGYLICQFQSAGVEAWKIPIVQALLAMEYHQSSQIPTLSYIENEDHPVFGTLVEQILHLLNSKLVFQRHHHPPEQPADAAPAEGPGGGHRFADHQGRAGRILRRHRAELGRAHRRPRLRPLDRPAHGAHPRQLLQLPGQEAPGLRDPPLPEGAAGAGRAGPAPDEQEFAR
jgi:23S rRNA (cytosine1962-C5)-methyltransferase